MLPEEAMVSSFNLTERDEREEENADEPGLGLKSILWHGGSVYDAWFSCASNQVLKQKHSQVDSLHYFLFVLSEKDWLMFGFTGCSGSVNAAILFLSNGDAFRDYSAGLLWSAWKLDCLSDQCSLRRVPKPKGERECQLQEPCHSSKALQESTQFHATEISQFQYTETDIFSLF